MTLTLDTHFYCFGGCSRESIVLNIELQITEGFRFPAATLIEGSALPTLGLQSF